jgi:hypothetical protein
VPVIQPSARTVPLLRAVVLALKAAPKEMRADINKGTRDTLNPIWREAIATHANGSRMDNLVFGKGARVAAGNPSRAIAASSRRALRPGTNPFIPDVMGRALEFGADRGKTSTYTRKGKGKAHSVTRRTTTGLPARNRRGRVVYPAFAEVAPRMVSLWTQTVVRVLHESFEKR